MAKPSQPLDPAVWIAVPSSAGLAPMNSSEARMAAASGSVSGCQRRAHPNAHLVCCAGAFNVPAGDGGVPG
ncbi:hypothetical protein [Paenarthrobacter sp. PH39-S1]|uniref:hypothetical protein n=1 Tax=Paenarthrobacter sp. PH39-S1 TaxID=3046204 RepID=UPI0032D99B1B